MRQEIKERIHQSVKENSNILYAAITGSATSRAREDEFSDLDLLLVSKVKESILSADTWLPKDCKVLLQETHLADYQTIVLSDFEKIDVSIYSVEEYGSKAIVHGFEIIKGDHTFETTIKRLNGASEDRRATATSRDSNVANLVLLLFGAYKRSLRGERLSASTFLNIASDMFIEISTASKRFHPLFDPLDPRRHLEVIDGNLEDRIADVLFCTPSEGITKMCLLILEGSLLAESGHRLVLERILSEMRPRH